MCYLCQFCLWFPCIVHVGWSFHPIDQSVMDIERQWWDATGYEMKEMYFCFDSLCNFKFIFILLCDALCVWNLSPFHIHLLPCILSSCSNKYNQFYSIFHVSWNHSIRRILKRSKKIFQSPDLKSKSGMPLPCGHGIFVRTRYVSFINGIR